MNEPGIHGVVLAHGTMAVGLVDAVRAITGVPADVLIPVSNGGLSPQVLADRVAEAVGGRPSIVFTDLPSGSCGFAARLLARNVQDIAVVCGVNLPMLLDFVMHRELAREELLERLVSKARASIHSVTAPAPKHGDPAVQG